MLPSLNQNIASFVAQVEAACAALGYADIDAAAVADALIRERPGFLLKGVMEPVPQEAIQIVVGRILKGASHRFVRAPVPASRTLWQRLWGRKP